MAPYIPWSHHVSSIVCDFVHILSKTNVKINFLGRADTKSTSSHRLDFQLKGIYSHIHVYTLQLSRASKL